MRPIQTVLIQEDQGDIFRRLGRFGQQPYPPVPGPRLETLEPTEQPDQPDQHSAAQGYQSTLQDLFNDISTTNHDESLKS